MKKNDTSDADKKNNSLDVHTYGKVVSHHKWKKKVRFTVDKNVCKWHVQFNDSPLQTHKKKEKYCYIATLHNLLALQQHQELYEKILYNIISRITAGLGFQPYHIPLLCAELILLVLRRDARSSKA